MALMPPEESLPVETVSPVAGSLWKCLLGSAILMYEPMYHIQSEPPMAPYRSRERRPRRSMRKKSQKIVTMVLTTPKTPVVRSEVEVPLMPMDLKTVGE